MQTDPELRAALERWKAGDDRLAAVEMAEDYLRGLRDDPGEVLHITEDDLPLVSQYRDEPTCAALLEVAEHGRQIARHLSAV